MADLNAMYVEAEQLKDEGKHEEAIAKLTELLKLDPNHVLSHLALSVLYGRVNQHELAVQHGETACQLEPNEPFNFTAMSVTFQRAWAGTKKQEYITKAEDAMARAQMLQGTPGH